MIVWSAEYDAFGRTTVDISSTITQQPLRFPGQYYDEETGLHYNWNRYYDPDTGRYITSDPIGLGGGLNTYGYAMQNPINLIDPTGLITWEGKVTVSDVGYILGGALITAELESECIDGKKYTVFVEGLVGGINLGFLPVGSSSSNEKLDDGLPNIDPSIFNGSAELGVISAQVSRGLAITDLKLGSARTPKTGRKPNVSSTTGFGEGALITVGRSWLKAPPLEESCECE